MTPDRAAPIDSFLLMRMHSVFRDAIAWDDAVARDDDEKVEPEWNADARLMMEIIERMLRERAVGR